MSEQNKFDILGQKVSDLIQRYKEVKDKSRKYESVIKRLEIDIELLEDKIVAFEDEKLDIKNNINKIIGKIEELEAGE